MKINTSLQIGTERFGCGCDMGSEFMTGLS